MTTAVYPSFFGRQLMLWRLYKPILKAPLIVYATVPLLLMLLCALLHRLTGHDFIWLCTTPVSIMVVIAPIVLNRADFRTLTGQLPVSAADKTWFLILLFWFLFPLTAYFSDTLGALLGEPLFGVDMGKACLKAADTMEEFGMDFGALTVISNILQTVTFITVCLFFTVKARGNRALAGMLSAFVAYLIEVVLISGITVTAMLAGHVFADPERFVGSGAADAVDTTMRYMAPWIRYEFVLLDVIAVAAIAILLVKLRKRLVYSGF